MSETSPKGPPKDVAPSELWTALTNIPRPWKVVDFPRVDPITGDPIGQVAIWVLTQEEQIAASAEADQVAKRICKDAQKNGEANLGYEIVYGNEATVQVLYRACRDVKDLSRPAFPSASLLRKQLSVDEISVLAIHYMQVQGTIGPIIASMTAEEEKLWIGRLAEAGDVFPTGLLSSREQERLLLSMASQLVSFWTGTSSPGSAPASGGTEESPPTDLTIASEPMTPDDHIATDA